jgi:hypothetical protein
MNEEEEEAALRLQVESKGLIKLREVRTIK